jgi:hypothetical protein
LITPSLVFADLKVLWNLQRILVWLLFHRVFVAPVGILVRSLKILFCERESVSGLVK